MTISRLTLAGLSLALVAPHALADRPRCLHEAPVVEASTPSGRFEVADALVTDKATGLMWTRCVVGYSFSAERCSPSTGSTSRFGWKDAIAKAEDPAGNGTGVYLGKSGWRVPNVKELASIIEHGCYSPSVNTVVFPDTPPARVWTSSPLKQESNTNLPLKAWVVNFDEGKAEPAGASYNLIGTTGGQPLYSPVNPYFLRLVRDAN